MQFRDIFLYTESKYMFLAVLFVYILGGFFSLFFQNKPKVACRLSNIFAAVASLLALSFSIVKLSLHTNETLNFSFNSNIQNMALSFRIDNLSAFFVLIISFLSLVVSIYSLGYLEKYYNKRNLGFFGFLYNIFIAAMIMVVTSGHLFFFIVVWEVMSLASYFLVVFENEKSETQKAGSMFIIMTHIGTAFITSAFILIYKFTGSAYLSEMDYSKIPLYVKNIIFFFSLIGFGTKAYNVAPNNISSLMSAVMKKTAIYGVIRISFDMLGGQQLWWGISLIILGAVSTILGIAFALMENNIKRLLSYSSIENLGIIFVALGISIITYSQNYKVIAAFALTGGLLHALNHSLFKGLLFLGAGSVEFSTGSKDMEKLGGLIKKLPYTAFFFLIGCLSISALPPFNGFVSEWIIYQSLFAGVGKSGGVLSILLILCIAVLGMAGVFAATSFIKTFGITFLALPRSEESKNAKEVPLTMLCAMGILSLSCGVLGLFPSVAFKILDPINADLMKIQAADNIKTYSSFVFVTGQGNSSISLFALLLGALIMVPVSIAVVKILGPKAKTRIYGTWDCGYRNLNSKMQYSSTGFSKPVRIVFRALYRPSRELRIAEGETPYFFRKGWYIVSTQSLFEKFLYEPVIKNIINFSRRVRFAIQTGSIHTYLMYIFLVVVTMLIYYVSMYR